MHDLLAWIGKQEFPTRDLPPELLADLPWESLTSFFVEHGKMIWENWFKIY